MPLHGAALPRSIARLSASASSQSVLGGLQHRYRRNLIFAHIRGLYANEASAKRLPEEPEEREVVALLRPTITIGRGLRRAGFCSWLV
jgi:hypothetical protein